MKLYKILSILLHPIFMPTFVMLILLNEVEFFNILFSNYKRTLITIVVIFTIIIPIIIFLFLLRLTRIKSLEMKTIKERNLPLFYTILMMILGFSFFKKIAFLSIHLCNIFIGYYCFNNSVFHNKKMENKLTYVGYWSRSWKFY